MGNEFKREKNRVWFYWFTLYVRRSNASFRKVNCWRELKCVQLFLTLFNQQNTRFGEGAEWIKKIEEVTGFKAINSIVGAEPLGPKIPLDCMVIAPLTGNSMSKFANAMTDSPVLMAAKATLRNGKPVVLAVSTE